LSVRLQCPLVSSGVTGKDPITLASHTPKVSSKPAASVLPKHQADYGRLLRDQHLAYQDSDETSVGEKAYEDVHSGVVH